MAICPFAEWKPAGTPGGSIVPRVVILHTEATSGKARPHSGLEWHFWIGNDGKIEQLVDTNRRADANYLANNFAISVETEDDGTPENDPWTPQQLDSIIKLCRWANAAHNIPLVRCDNPSGSGIGYHTMWGAPSNWTPVAKTCPGAARKLQFNEVIIPLLTTAPPVEKVVVTSFKEKVAMKPLLRIGSTGIDVRIMQGLLIAHGNSIKVDGSFGPITDRVLRNWQTRTNILVSDGICGPATWTWLVNV